MSMLTTTLDGLWVLQALTGWEVLAPELGLRPHFPRMEAKELALAHPAAAELRSVGALGDDDAVDHVIAEWLAVLGRRELALLIYQYDNGSGIGERHLLTRFARWWVSLKRHEATVEMSGIGEATTEESAASLIGCYLQQRWGAAEPADFRPLTLSVERLVEAARCTESTRPPLGDGYFDREQAAILTLAADCSRSTQRTVVALQSCGGGALASSDFGAGAVTVIDTPRGRVLAEHLHRDGTSWLLLGPASQSSIMRAVVRMLRRLPAQETWHTYRKVV